MHCASTKRTTRFLAALLIALATLPLAYSQSVSNADLDRIRGDIGKLRRRLEDVRAQARSAQRELEASDLEQDMQRPVVGFGFLPRGGHGIGRHAPCPG